MHEPDLSVGPTVLTEGRVLAVATGSDLAGRESVSMEDLAGRTALDPGPLVPDYWFEAMVPKVTGSGHPVTRGQAARTFHELLALLATGALVCPLNAHVRRHHTPPGITFVPIHDAPATEWALVWPTPADNARLRAFVRTATDAGPRPMGDRTG
ncbi:LysR substrate-binding domain-containing protein [Kitasatospora sp. NPDC091207]|uniref:LysR substrate-binding domain-containing protein n=1 Tax=Kitasatospora sp. NPDC091207 TaxID=3364083 RepID=UPI00381E7CD0